jgi:hypothetical protein
LIQDLRTSCAVRQFTAFATHCNASTEKWRIHRWFMCNAITALPLWD